MQTFLDLCRRRYSVRDYKPQPIPQEILDYVIECVRMAPSAVNRQPWRLQLVQTPTRLRQLHACYDREWFATAPACFIVCRDTDTEWVRPSDGKPHGDIDVAIATEHLCLAAAEKGLGTCWVCNFDVAQCRRAFDIPDTLIPVALVPIGYPSDESAAKPKNRGTLSVSAE